MKEAMDLKTSQAEVIIVSQPAALQPTSPEVILELLFLEVGLSVDTGDSYSSLPPLTSASESSESEGIEQDSEPEFLSSPSYTVSPVLTFAPQILDLAVLSGHHESKSESELVLKCE